MTPLVLCRCVNHGENGMNHMEVLRLKTCHVTITARDTYREQFWYKTVLPSCEYVIKNTPPPPRGARAEQFVETAQAHARHRYLLPVPCIKSMVRRATRLIYAHTIYGSLSAIKYRVL